jgi:myo-inositol 2-dehydrogenase/D-chiro-inositol 1-dehydrogenase
MPNHTRNVYRPARCVMGIRDAPRRSCALGLTDDVSGFTTNTEVYNHGSQAFDSIMNENRSVLRPTTRRHFLQTSSTAMVGGLMVAGLPSLPRAFAANTDTLKLGVIGCGGRGSGAVTEALAADANVVLTAMGDAFADRLQGSLAGLRESKKINPKTNQPIGSQVKVDPDHCFTGFDAYQKVLNSGGDVVILATPPGFRPQHLEAAVAAGKHIFCEKPMATDVPGVRSVIATVELAKKKSLALVAGFCWRYNLAERAGFQKIHEGAIGDIRAVYSTYNTGSLWCFPRRPEWTDMEWHMRNWYYFTWLSGDHIVEQAVHSIDKIAWAMKDQPPVRALAHGGRQVRTGPEFGHIFDHFSVVYDYADGAKGFLFCRQQDSCSNDTSDTIMGAKGVARVLGFRGPPEIKGETDWRYEGPRPDMYQVEHDELFASIRAGKPINDGSRMVQSTQMAILGRMAGYTGQSITWEEALKSKEDLHPANYDWNQPMPVPPVAMPGKTKFI